MTSEPAGRQNGLAIRALRKMARLSTGELAEQVGLEEQSLRNIENGSRPASDEVIYALARALGVPTGAITRDAREWRHEVPQEALRRPAEARRLGRAQAKTKAKNATGYADKVEALAAAALPLMTDDTTTLDDVASQLNIQPPLPVGPKS